MEASLTLGSVFGRTDFPRIFIFGPPDFFLGFCRRIGSHFCWKKCNKNPRHISGEGRAKIFESVPKIRHAKDHKPLLLGSDVFQWGGVLPLEGVGAKKFGMSLETKGNFFAIFGKISRNFCRDIRAQYDWTTGVPDNGNEWRKFRAVPRSYPLRSLVVYIVS